MEFDLPRVSNNGEHKSKLDDHLDSYVTQFKYSKITDFPFHVFPKQIQNIIIETNEHLSYPIEFISSSLMVATSIAIGTTREIQTKVNWRELSVLYLALVGKAGTNKSHPLEFALKPIIKRDSESYKQYKDQLNDLDNKGQTPRWKKHLCSDITPESLAEKIQNNERGIGLYCDELAMWFKNFGRYNKGSEEEFWLSIWSGKTVNVDRKKESIYVERPFVSVVGTIQNSILYELGNNNRALNGFIDRLLFVIPDNLKKQYFKDTDISENIIKEWDCFIDCLFRIKDKKVLLMSDLAKDSYKEWFNQNADDCNSINDALAGAYSKMDIYVCRFALIIQMMNYACNTETDDNISVNSMNGAIELVGYFKDQAINYHRTISENKPEKYLSQIEQQFYKDLPESFTVAEIKEMTEKNKISRAKLFRLLNKEELFIKLKHGQYKKRLNF